MRKRRICFLKGTQYEFNDKTNDHFGCHSHYCCGLGPPCGAGSSEPPAGRHLVRRQFPMKQKGRHSVLWGFIYVITFVVVYAVSALIKMAHDPFNGKYSVVWSDEIGTVYNDLSYGEGEANKFDLYVPADSTKESYGLFTGYRGFSSQAMRSLSSAMSARRMRRRSSLA